MIYIVQNDPDVPSGRILEILDRTCMKYTLVRAWKNEIRSCLPEDSSCLVILGGTMGADEEDRYPYLIDVYKWIRHAFNKGIPLLGVCLGGQMLARSTGGELKKNLCGEKGITSVCLTDEGEKDPLFKGLSNIWPTFQWHDDSFVPPSFAVNLAVSSGCIYQAFRIEKNAYGVQFHPEVTAEIVAAWTGKARQTEIFMNDFNNQYSEYEKISDQLLTNFFGMN